MHESDTLSRAIIQLWYDLNTRFGDDYSVSEAALAQLFFHELIKRRYCADVDLCPESFYRDHEDMWRRIDLLIGPGLLHESGLKRVARKRRLTAAVEFKVDSLAVSNQPHAIEKDCAKLQSFAETQVIASRNFNLFALFRCARPQSRREAFWLDVSSRFSRLRLVVASPSDDGQRVVHYQRGRAWDIAKNRGAFYDGWPLRR